MAQEYIAGPLWVIQWIYSGGTISLGADTRTAGWAATSEFVDATAGADTSRRRLATFKDGTFSLSWLDQTNAAGTATAMDAGTSGTLIYGPEGTATGKRKLTIPAFSQGAKYNWPFDNVAEVTCDFMSNGPYTDGTW